MMSLVWKGRILEAHLGSERFAQLVAWLATVSAVLYVAVGWGLAQMGYYGPFHTCAAGFSAVLFGMKVIMPIAD